MKLNKNIYVAGHSGMVGSALLNKMKNDGNINIISESHSNLDLTNQNSTRIFFEKKKIDEIYLVASKVGGIKANTQYPADFLYINLMIQLNVIKCAFEAGIKKILFFGSSCIYPKECLQPMSEEFLLTGKLEPTNESYAIAKIAGIKLCEAFNRQFQNLNIDYRSVMPTNIYGPGDNYTYHNSHVIPSLIRRFYEATIQNKKFVDIWGSGSQMREFLFVDDLAEAAIFIMNIEKQKLLDASQNNESHVNIGSGHEITIKDLSEIIANLVGFRGDIIFDESKPGGSKRKLINSKKINDLGWRSKISLKKGLEITIDDFIKNYEYYKNK